MPAFFTYMTQIALITLDELLKELPNGGGDTAVLVRRAYEFANKNHNGRHRESGELFIDHDLAVAQIMISLGVDTSTVIASILHDSLLPHTEQTTKIIEQVGHGLVELIEGGKINSAEMTELLHSYLNPMIEANIDYLVLGCSHYPYLIPQIREILPANIQIIDSGEAVARQTQKVLTEIGFNSLQDSKPVFYTNTNPKVLKDILKEEYEVVEQFF